MKSGVFVSMVRKCTLFHFIPLAKLLTATVPSVGDAIAALNDLCTCLTTAFKNVIDLSAELAARDSIRVDSISQVRYFKSTRKWSKI